MVCECCRGLAASSERWCRRVVSSMSTAEKIKSMCEKQSLTSDRFL